MKINWHSINLAEVFSHLASGPAGLPEQEAVQRLEKTGKNVLPQEKPLSKLRLFLSQFNNPLMYILLCTVAISFSLKHYSDTVLICLVLLINTAVGFYQENKANQSLLSLRQLVKIRARILRTGSEKEVDSEMLVPGDVVILKAGDKVPADGRIIESSDFKINESSLTGEWKAVDKKTGELSGDLAVGDRSNMVFMGTIVEDGRAKIIVTSTGLQTEIGEIVSLLKETKEEKTPLQKKIISLSKITGVFILSVIAVIIVIGYLTEKSLADIFIAALALAVSATPEGLLPAITVILVLGMRRILKHKGLIRRLVANETLGSVTVICTDKTGTLTEGKMKVSHILTSTNELMGNGLNGVAKGENGNGVESHISALKISVLANEAFVENPDAELQEWIVRGRATEQALLLAGLEAGLGKKELEERYPVLDRINFSSDIKYAATLNRFGQKETLLAIGAPEIILDRCAFLDIDGRKEKIGGQEFDKLIQKFESLAEKGLRVLACAHREFESGKKYEKMPELMEELTLVGFIALKDPLRPDAKESIVTTKKAGIRTVIVTGDHKLTARAVAQEIGVDFDEHNIIEGGELEKISDEELKERAKLISIYARVSPKHKLRIVDALQANGEVVAMLGDGVNDAPALKAADIGVAVGSGTDVAKEVADLVLLDDNFKTIIKAIEQGRVILGNIRKVFVYLIADDFSELFLFLASMAFGLPLPLLAAQILWINLVEDGFPSIALTTEQEKTGVMEEKPNDPKESIINRPMRLWMLAIFFITGLAAFLTFVFLWKLTGDLEKTRTIVFALMCVDSLIFAFSVRSFRRSILHKDILSNRYLLVAVAIGVVLLAGAIYLPPLQKLLSTENLGWVEWVLILTVSIIETIFIEWTKRAVFSRRPESESALQKTILVEQ